MHWQSKKTFDITLVFLTVLLNLMAFDNNGDIHMKDWFTTGIVQNIPGSFTCDDPSEKVWTIICCAKYLTTDPHAVNTLFQLQHP